MQSQANGRVVNVDAFGFSDFEVGTNKQTPKNFVNDALRGNLGRGPVSDLFFSDRNIDALQLGLHNMVLDKSCGKYNIGRQSINELLVVMRGIYLQDSKNILHDVVGQVRDLNAQVLAFLVPRIMSELDMHETYIKDVNTMPVPISRGENTGIYGSDPLVMKRL